MFDSAWAVEDDMIQAGFARAQARQLSLMFVALASSKKDGYVNRNSDSYWDFWEVSDVSHMSDCLERAGAEKYTGYTLANAMLHFARKEWDS